MSTPSIAELAPVAASSIEEALMVQYVSGDGSAFRELFARLAPPVHAFFLRSFRDPSTADELMQETFLKIHRGRRTYRSDLPLRPWIFTIAAHVRRDELRRRRRIKEDCDEERLAAAEEAEAFDVSTQREQAPATLTQAVREALEGLPETQRVVVHLNRFEHMTFAEIARVLGTSEVAVRGRAFRAYAQLRRALSSVLDEWRSS
jgi:RNA polymerase sigma-70 factor (ECF subfamily)